MMYMWMEALYHVPLSIWAIGALLRGTYWQMSRKARDDSGLATAGDADLQCRFMLGEYNANSKVTSRRSKSPSSPPNLRHADGNHDKHLHCGLPELE